MSDSENSSSASANVSDSSEHPSTATSEDIWFSPPKKCQRRMLEDNVTSSQEDMLDDMVEPSQLDESPWNLDCNFKPARYLKFAIETLNNLEVSCELSGRIDVDDNGFNITVQNSGNHVLGHLHLKPAEFKCTKSLNGKSFSFLLLSMELAGVEDEGTVYLTNGSRTDQLDILVLLEGTEYNRRFSVQLGSDALPKFPDMLLFFTATVPSDDFGAMIRHLLQQKNPQVSVDIKDSTATLRAGKVNPWTATYAMLRADGSSAMEAGEKKSYSTSFGWSNASVPESLLKASELDAEFVVLFHAERPERIILRFNLGDVGYLEFMRECRTIC